MLSLPIQFIHKEEKVLFSLFEETHIIQFKNNG